MYELGELQIIEQNGVRVLTSKQLAKAYATTSERIKQNYQANRGRYVEKKHYICLSKENLKAFKNRGGNSNLVSSKANILYLWTEKGALLHAKSLNTDKAWEVYDYLVDFYFRAKEKPETSVVPSGIEEETNWMEQALKEAAEKAYRRQIGYCRAIVNSILENERGAMGSVLATYGLLSDDGKKQAMGLMRGRYNDEGTL